MTDDGWLTDHVLGEDDGAERERAGRRIDADPDLRRRSEQLRGVVAQLEALSPEVWSRLEDRADDDAVPDADLAAPARPSPTGDRAVAIGHRVGRWRDGRRRGGRRELAVAGLLVGAVAIGTALGAVAFSSRGGQGGAPVRRTVALRPLSAAGTAHGTLRIGPSGQARLQVTGLARSGPGRFYEAWLMSSRTRLVAIASFRVGAGGDATVSTSLPAAATGYRYVDVSLQRAAAGPEHSSDSVLRGPTRRVATG